MAYKKIHWLAAAGGIALVSVAAWWLQRPAPHGSSAASAASQGASAPGVEVAPVRVQRLVEAAQSVGTLRSRQSVTLRPETAGRIVRIAFADGAPVRQGQLLVQLDDTLQRAELSQAQAQLSIARATHKRNEELVAQNFLAQRVLDESRASLQVAQAQVELAQARLVRMGIVAPFAGTVGIRNVNLGDYVKDGADLVHLEDTSALYVDFRLPERYQARLGVGQSVAVQLDALPGRDFKARVLAVDPLIDANGRALLVRAAMPPAPGAVLRPGLFARVTVALAVTEQALMVPEEAVVPQGGQSVVFRLVHEGAADAPPVAHRTEVMLGVRREGRVQVLAGLQAGDTVVVAGQQRLQRDAMPVRVIDLAGPAGTAGTAAPAQGPSSAPSAPAGKAG